MERRIKTIGAAALEKAFDVLYSFEALSPEQSLSQISRKLHLPPSTARRLLKVMASRGLIQQDPITKLYRLGSGVLLLASIAQHGLEIRRIALPVMEKLRDAAGENVTLNELREGKRICIEKVESKEIVRDTILVGDRFPAHCGASGKAMLAYESAEELEHYCRSKPLEALTPRTITDPRKLMAELARVRKNGFAFSCGERVMDGLCAISAPIFDHKEGVRYSLTITLTPFRLRLKGRDRLVRLVKEFAAEISKKLGRRTPAKPELLRKPKL